MKSWFDKLTGEDGRRDLGKAVSLTPDECREWLKDHFNDQDPSRSLLDDEDPISLFEEVWEANPEPAFRSVFTAAILREFGETVKTPEENSTYLGFIVRLMIYLPVVDFPEHLMLRSIRSEWSGKSESSGGITIRSLMLQALFARTEPSISFLETMLKSREGVNLAYKKFRDKGLAEAVKYLPDVMTTLSGKKDEIFLITHLKAVFAEYGEDIFVSRIQKSGILSNGDIRARLQQLCYRIDVELDKPVADRFCGRSEYVQTVSREEIDTKVAKAFDLDPEKLNGSDSRQSFGDKGASPW